MIDTINPLYHKRGNVVRESTAVTKHRLRPVAVVTEDEAEVMDREEAYEWHKSKETTSKTTGLRTIYYRCRAGQCRAKKTVRFGAAGNATVEYRGYHTHHTEVPRKKGPSKLTQIQPPVRAFDPLSGPGGKGGKLNVQVRPPQPVEAREEAPGGPLVGGKAQPERQAGAAGVLAAFPDFALSVRISPYLGIVLGTRNTITVVQGAKALFIESTRRFTPNYLKDVLTVYFVLGRDPADERAAVPCLYYITNTTDARAFKEFLSELRLAIPRSWQDAEIVMEFDDDMRSAARAVFPEAHTVGCAFHLLQNLSLKAQEIQGMAAHFAAIPPTLKYVIGAPTHDDFILRLDAFERRYCSLNADFAEYFADTIKPDLTACVLSSCGPQDQAGQVVALNVSRSPGRVTSYTDLDTTSPATAAAERRAMPPPPNPHSSRLTRGDTPITPLSPRPRTLLTPTSVASSLASSVAVSGGGSVPEPRPEFPSPEPPARPFGFSMTTLERFEIFQSYVDRAASILSVVAAPYMSVIRELAADTAHFFGDQFGGGKSKAGAKEYALPPRRLTRERYREGRLDAGSKVHAVAPVEPSGGKGKVPGFPVVDSVEEVGAKVHLELAVGAKNDTGRKRRPPRLAIPGARRPDEPQPFAPPPSPNVGLGYNAGVASEGGAPLLSPAAGETMYSTARQLSQKFDGVAPITPIGAFGPSFSPRGLMMSPRGGLVSPRGGHASPRGGLGSPRHASGSTLFSPRGTFSGLLTTNGSPNLSSASEDVGPPAGVAIAGAKRHASPVEHESGAKRRRVEPPGRGLTPPEDPGVGGKVATILQTPPRGEGLQPLPTSRYLTPLNASPGNPTSTDDGFGAGKFAGFGGKFVLEKSPGAPVSETESFAPQPHGSPK